MNESQHFVSIHSGWLKVKLVKQVLIVSMVAFVNRFILLFLPLAANYGSNAFLLHSFSPSALRVENRRNNEIVSSIFFIDRHKIRLDNITILIHNYLSRAQSLLDERTQSLVDEHCLQIIIMLCVCIYFAST